MFDKNHNFSFKLQNGIVRICKTEGLVITAPNEIITSVNDQNGTFYHSLNVKIVHIQHQTVNFLPKEIEKLFPDIEGFQIQKSKLKEIAKEDLSPFPLLKVLWLNNNELEFLPSDLFDGNPELWFINCDSNKVKFVGENIFSSLKKLRYANFESNTCIDKCAEKQSEVLVLEVDLKRKCMQSFYVIEIEIVQENN